MLSIVIPTLNEEKFLPGLLASIQSQDFKDFEIIVADNNSTDRTVAIAKEFGCQVVKGGTLCEGRNRGAEAASGRLILFMDADTKLPDSDSLGSMVKEFQERNLDVASCFLQPFKKHRIISPCYDLFYNQTIFLLQKIFPAGASCFLIKKELHQKFGGFNEEIIFFEDLPYLRSMVAAGGEFGVLKSAKVFVSERRYEKEGWIKTQVKIVLAIVYTLLFGPIKKDIFKYHFKGYD